MSALEIVSRGNIMPITLEEAKAHLRVTITEEDDLITQQIKEAVSLVEGICLRSLVQTTYRLTADCLPSNTIRQRLYLKRPPVVSIGSFKVIAQDGSEKTMIAGTDYYQSLAGKWPYLCPVQTWPQISARPEAVEVIYTAGPDVALPDRVKIAIKAILGMLYEHRNESVPVVLNELPGASNIDRLLAGYKRHEL